MLDKIKKWFDEMLKSMGLTVPDAKKADLETALKTFAESLERDGGADTKAGDAFSDAIKKAFEGFAPKPPEKTEAGAGLDSNKLTEILTAALKPMQDEFTNIKKEFGELGKLRKEQENEGAKKKLQDALKEAHEKGKISSAQVKEYYTTLEEQFKESPKAFDLTLKAIAGLPDNSIIAKQNKAVGFSLDGKPQETPPVDEKNNGKGKEGKLPKSVLSMVDSKYLEKVNNDIKAV